MTAIEDKHACSAMQCEEGIGPRFAFCRHHYLALPNDIRVRLRWHARGSAGWKLAMENAIDYLGKKDRLVEYPRRVSGVKFVCEIPKGATSWSFLGDDGDVIAIGPDMPPQVWNNKTKRWKELKIDASKPKEIEINRSYYHSGKMRSV